MKILREIGNFEELIPQEDCRNSMQFESSHNDDYITTFSVKLDNYKEIKVSTCSVPDSFWKLFECVNPYDVKYKIIFIPENKFIISSIILGDKKTLQECSKWMDVVISRFYGIMEYYYNPQLSNMPNFNYALIDEYIPSQIKGTEQYRKFKQTWPYQDVNDFHFICNGINNDSLITSLSNYNPVVAIDKIKRLIELFPEMWLSCDSIIGYQVLVESGIARHNISIEPRNESEIIKVASENIDLVSGVGRRDILEYIINRNIDDTDDVMDLLHQYIIDNDDKEQHQGDTLNMLMIKSCITRYGSVDQIPLETLHFMKDITGMYQEVYEYMGPLINRLAKEGIPIHSCSPMMNILFPDVKYNIRNSLFQITELGALCENTLDADKSNILGLLCKKYTDHNMSIIYGLYRRGYISTEDIREYGLHHKYAVCAWIVNKNSRTKRAQ